MDFDGFSRFCSDFGIFPDILSKPKVFRFYKTLSAFYQDPKKVTSQPCIDEHLFIEALALAAFEVVYKDPQPENTEKVSPQKTNIIQIIMLIERMNHSKGP